MAARVPTIASPTNSRKQAEGAVLVSAMIVLVTYGYRKLLEPSASSRSTEPALRQIIGAEPKPAPVERFAIAYSFVYFTLSVGAVAAPELATGFAILVAVGYVLANGGAVFADITHQVGGKVSPPTPERSPVTGVRGTVNAALPPTARAGASPRNAGISGEAHG